MKDDDKFVVSIIRYDKDINERGAAINSMQGFSNREDASRARQLLKDLLKLTRYEMPTNMFYDAEMSEKKAGSFPDGYWNHFDIPIENENDRILQRQ